MKFKSKTTFLNTFFLFLIINAFTFNNNIKCMNQSCNIDFQSWDYKFHEYSHYFANLHKNGFNFFFQYFFVLKPEHRFVREIEWIVVRNIIASFEIRQIDSVEVVKQLDVIYNNFVDVKFQFYQKYKFLDLAEEQIRSLINCFESFFYFSNDVNDYFNVLISSFCIFKYYRLSQKFINTFVHKLKELIHNLENILENNQVFSVKKIDHLKLFCSKLQNVNWYLS